METDKKSAERNTIIVKVFGRPNSGKSAVAHSIKRLLDNMGIPAEVADEAPDPMPQLTERMNAIRDRMKAEGGKVYINTNQLGPVFQHRPEDVVVPAPKPSQFITPTRMR